MLRVEGRYLTWPLHCAQSGMRTVLGGLSTPRPLFGADTPAAPRDPPTPGPAPAPLSTDARGTLLGVFTGAGAGAGAGTGAGAGLKATGLTGMTVSKGLKADAELFVSVRLVLRSTLLLADASELENDSLGAEMGAFCPSVMATGVIGWKCGVAILRCGVGVPKGLGATIGSCLGPGRVDDPLLAKLVLGVAAPPDEFFRS